MLCGYFAVLFTVSLIICLDVAAAFSVQEQRDGGAVAERPGAEAVLRGRVAAGEEQAGASGS